MPEPTTSRERQPAHRAAARRSARWGRRRLRSAQFGWPLALALGGTLAGPAFAQNLPQGGTVVGGSGTIQQIDANLLQIQQNSQNLAIDWQSFNVGPSGIVRFLQPSSSSIALNRVIGNDPSAIYGQIQANGQVILLNARGIYFGPNSMVDVNAMVATTANIRNDDFMAGRLRFEEGSGDANARVVNEGLVSVAQGGFAILAAASVQNTGRIVANGGTVVLAGTKTFTVDFHGDGLLSFAATGTVDQAPSGSSALVDNSGIIEAAGGRVLMTARAARDVLDNVINTTGIVVARSAQMVNGEIVIDGGDNGIVNVAGTLDASGRNAGETGGTVKVLGEKVGLFAGASIDAAGDAGGGTVLVGGNYQGQGPERNAKMVYMDAAAVIDASAVTAGNGGKVILWADETTRFDGLIRARGGALGGDGGFVETSGKIVLRVGLGAMVDAAATAGRNGSWLLDPNNISIVAGAGASTNISGNPSFLSTDDSAQIYDTTINTALDGGNDVTVTTGTGGTNGQAGDILVSGAVLNSTGGARSFTLSAAGNISITGSIAGTGGNALSVVLGAAAGSVAINGTGIDTYGGSLSITAGAGVTQSAGLTSSAGAFALNLNLSGTSAATLTHAGNNFGAISITKAGSGNLSLATSVSPDLQASTITGGDFSITGVGFIQSGALNQSGGGTVAINGGTGAVTLSQANTIAGAMTITADSISVTASQTLASAVTLQPYTPGTNVVFNGSGGGLQISAATLGNLTGASALTVGSASAGTLSVGANYTGAAGQDLSLISGDAMSVAYNVISDGDLSLVSSKNVVVTGTLTTTGGDIYVTGNVASWTGPFDMNAPVFGSATGAFNGVSFSAGATIDAGGGDISIAGKGGDSGANLHGVLLSSGSAVQTSGAGKITIAGEGGTPAGGSNHIGIEIAGMVLTTGTGGIELTGTGGAATGAVNQSHGIAVMGTGSINGGAADVTLTGTGGSMAGSGNTNYGIQHLGQIQTTSGNITMTGVGSDSSGGSNFGVSISATAGVQTSGAGSVTITGSGGNAAGGLGHGVAISGTGTNVGKTGTGAGTVSITGVGGMAGGTNAGIYIDNNASIASYDGTLTLDGTGGGDGTSTTNHGTIIDTGAALLSTSGAITIVGIAGGSSGNGNHGIILSAAADIVSANGNISLAANGSGTGNNDAIHIDNSSIRSTASANITLRAATYGTAGTGIRFAGTLAQLGETTMTGDLTLRADAMATSATSLVFAHTAASGTVTFRTESDATTIGVNGGSGTLAIAGGLLTAADGSNFNTLKFGSATQNSAIQIDTTSFSQNVVFQTLDAVYSNGMSFGTKNLTIDAGGTYTQGGGISTSGLVTFSGTGAVTATDPGNTFTSVALTKTGGAAVSLTTTGALDFATSSLAGSALNVTAAGITQSGAITTSGAVLFNAGANAITLMSANALSGNVRFFNSGANDVNFTNSVATSLGGGTTSVGGNLGITSNGALTQASALTVAGNANFNAAGNALTLNNASNAVTGDVAFVNATDTVTWREAAAVSLAASSSAALSVQAGGAITQVGALTVTGAATFNAGANAITLNDGSNLFQGTVGLTATGGGGHVQLANSAGIAFGTSTIGGNLDVTRTSGTGDLTQSAPISVTGTTTISMNDGNLTINQGANSFGGAVSITKTGTGTVALQNGGPLVLGTSSIAGDFTVTANAGALTQTGVLTLGGDFTATAAGALTLDQINGYAVGKNVSLTATGANGAITVAADQVLSNGSFTAVGSAGVVVTAAIETGGGNVTLWGNSPGGVANGSTAGTFFGVEVESASAIIDAGGGNISIVGAGGSADYQHGVTVRNGAGIVTTGAGTLSITGRGGSGTAGSTAGVEFFAGGAYAQTQNGALTVTGIGGIGGGNNNTGVVMATGEIRATGTGAVTVTGTGGAGGSVGIGVAGGGATVISAVDGNLVLIGTGGGGDDLSGTFAGMHSWGVSLGSNADVKTTGTGNLTITANGGTDGVSDFRIGMVMQDGALVRTTAGTGLINIVANAGAGNGGDNSGFVAIGPSTAVRTSAGNLSLTGTGTGDAGNENTGIVIDAAIVESTGTGTVNLSGAGGFDGRGVVVQGPGGLVQSVDGNLNVTGIGGTTGSGGAAFGIHIVDAGGAGTVASIGLGTVTLAGTGGTAATPDNHGIVIEGGIIQADSGGAVFTGTGGGASGSGIVFDLGASVTTTTGGNISLAGTGSTAAGITAAAAGTLASAGTLTMTSNDGVAFGLMDITTAGNVTVTSTFNDVVLSSAANAISGTVTITASGGGNASLGNSLATTLGATNISGDLTVSVAGNLAQSAAMTVGGASSFASTGGSIVLTNASNVLTGAVTVSNATANATSIVNSVATSINNATTTGNLSVTSGGNLGQIGSLVVGGDMALTADGDITMANPANQAGSASFATTSGGNVTYASNSAINLQNVGVAGDLAVYTTGAPIVQTGAGAYTVGGTTDLTTITSGAITLNQANVFGQAVALTSAGAVTISAIQTVATSSFTVTAGGAITIGSGGGVTTSGGDIDLNATANLAMNTSSLSSNGGDITIVAGPGGFTGAEFLSTSINAGGGDISITGVGLASGNSQHGIWIGGGTNVTTTGAGDITLTGTGGAAGGGGNIGVFLYNGGAVQAQNGTVTVIGQGAGGGGSNHGVAFNLGGQITSTGGNIFVTGTGSTGAGGGDGVWIDGTGSKIESGSGNVTVTGTGAVSGAGNDGVRIANAGYVGTTSGSIGVTGDAGGSAGIGIALADGVGTGGITSLGAGTIALVGTGTGGLAGIGSSGSNSIIGGGSATGGITLQTDKIDLASGSVIQTAGMLTIDTITPGLSIGINDSGSSLNIDGATFANVTASVVRIGGASATGQITIGADATNSYGENFILENGAGAPGVAFNGAFYTSGDLTVMTGGTITQTAAVAVDGMAGFVADGNIVLGNAANAMAGGIGFSSTGGNVTIANTGPTDFHMSDASGTLDVSVTTGTVSQLGAITTGGAVTVTSQGAILWNNASNAFGGPLNVTTTAGADATFFNASATTFGTVSVDGDLSVTSGGAIAQGGTPLAVVGTSSFQSAGNTTLANASNSFGGAVGITTTAGGHAGIAATGQLILGTSSIAGNFSASVGSPMTQTGALAVAGTSDFAATNGPLTLTNSSNTFGGMVSLTNTGNFAVGISASGALTLGDVSMTGGSTGGFTATASNGIAQSGGTTIQAGAGATVLAGGGGTVVLGEAGNSFGNTVSLSGTGGSLAGMVNGQSGAAAAPFVTATGGIFDVNGTTVGSAPVTPPSTGTQAVLNEIAAVAPIDSATRVVDSPSTGSAGLGSPAIDSTLSSSTSDLTGGSGGTQGEESSTPTVAGAQTPAPGQPAGSPPPTGPAGGTGAPPTTIVLSDGGTGGSTTNDVRSDPAPQPGPTTLVPGVLVNNPTPPGGTVGGTPGITQSFPQQGNSSLW